MRRYYIRVPGYPLPLVSDDLILKRNLHGLLINYIALRDSYIKYHKFRSNHYGRDNFKAIYYAKLYLLSAYEFCELLASLKIPKSDQLLTHFDTSYSRNSLNRARHSIAHNKERIQELQYEHKVNRVKSNIIDKKSRWVQNADTGFVKRMNLPSNSIILDMFNLDSTDEGDFWHDCLINDYYFLMDMDGRIEIDLSKTSENFVLKSQKILQSIIDSYDYSFVFLERL